MDWLAPLFERAQRFLFVAAPHPSGGDPQYTTLCAHDITEGLPRAQATPEAFSCAALNRSDHWTLAVYA